jgi:CheY-like chemotaxis protein
VLLADDDPMVAAYVSKVLPADQFHLEVVNTGEECLHLLRTQPKGFDLLLLDLMMPETSGYDVLREMALRGTAAAMPVIVLTAYPDSRNEEERRLLEHGLVLEVISKTDIHERPPRLTEAIDVHLSSMSRRTGREPVPKPEVVHFGTRIPERDSDRRAA